VQDYFANTDNRYSEYATICSRIEEAIRMDQIEGGMVGQYNASITQRINALKEHTDVTSGDEKISAITVTIVK
jgi:HPt (histidine-containing phosphotransfer) domain-containing protein